MYYHSRDLKYVTYGKVYPPPSADVFFDPLYHWLGRHCGFCPQVWLARSRSQITGFRGVAASSRIIKQYEDGSYKIKKRIYKTENILFGFDIIKGFPISYEPWCLLMGSLSNEKDFQKQNAEVIASLDRLVKWTEEDGDPLDEPLQAWVNSGKNLDKFLKDYVFVERDQVVVPSLNLKSAKKIICCNEKQKKALRRMGFIEDRIKIKNIKRWDFV